MKSISKKSDIDFDEILIKIKSVLNKNKESFRKLNSIKEFYEKEHVDNYKVNNAIVNEMLDLGKVIELGKTQLACEHQAIIFDEHVGNDSHKDYYNTYCTECKYIFDQYSI